MDKDEIVKEMDVFEIDEMPGQQFRIKHIPSTTLLSLQSTFDFDNIERLNSMYTFIFENMETNIGGVWVPVKEKGREVYMPVGIDNVENVRTLAALAEVFIHNFYTPLFRKSNESM